MGLEEILEKVKQLPAQSWAKDIGEAILDEVQKDPTVLEKLNYCLDNKSLQSSVLLGSCNLSLLTQIKDALAGRFSVYQLFPFMVSEIIEQCSLQPPLLELLLQSASDGWALL